MAARAMWKGRVAFGTVDVPVKLYAAVQSTAGVHFRLLDDKDKQPIKQQMVNPRTEKVVPYEEVKRAYPTEDGHLVILDEEELATLEPEASRDIHVSRFMDPDVITHAWYDRPYYLGPDGADEEYFALVQALAKQEKEGLAHWVMRKKEYVGALRAEGDYLVLVTLRRAGEVIPASALPSPGGRKLEAAEVRMAKQLVAALEGDFDLAAFRDEYHERVLELVEAKREGKVLKMPKAARKKPAEKDLAALLEQSLAAAKGRKSA